jgi:hypothetical protein
LVVQTTSLIVVAVFFTVASACYLFAALSHQEYLKLSFNVTGSDSLDGQVGDHIVRSVI